jgi:hypothetical protein
MDDQRAPNKEDKMGIGAHKKLRSANRAHNIAGFGDIRREEHIC